MSKSKSTVMTNRTKARTSSKSKAKREITSEETEGIFYKVFAKEQIRGKETLVSPSITGRLKLHYPIGRKTIANPEMINAGYGIMIFRDIEDARSWGGYHKPIYRVRVGKVFNPPASRLHRDVLGYYRDGKGKSLFEDTKTSWRVIVKRLKEKLDVVNNWPRGTVMTDWVIPVEE